MSSPDGIPPVSDVRISVEQCPVESPGSGADHHPAVIRPPSGRHPEGVLSGRSEPLFATLVPMSGVVTCGSCGVRNRVPLATSGSPRCASCHHDLPWLVDADDRSFADAVRTNRLVLVDLWAPWCGPCRMVAPILERLAHDFAGRVKVVKVNVDKSSEVAGRYHAASIPMLLVMRDGAVVDTVVGAQPEHVFRDLVDRHLAG